MNITVQACQTWPTPTYDDRRGDTWECHLHEHGGACSSCLKRRGHLGRERCTLVRKTHQRKNQEGDTPTTNVPSKAEWLSFIVLASHMLRQGNVIHHAHHADCFERMP